ncbi:M48 family metallopeptidase [uncultured Croceicoccus sp.]|uniref:M48 family metallopeptidase n=1 Tax=uncultured Croceicoccus sp. TaxID=1295329 RepID=UPI00263403EB|nr:M48 family metallopeptidase [uncultured Croceicoccus sp.]
MAGMPLPFPRAMRRGAAVLAALGLLCGAQAHADDKQNALRQIARLDRTIAAVGHRLARGNVGRCADRAFLPGFSVHDLSQYSAAFRDAAVAEFALGHGPRILAVVPGGAADRAGLREGDLLRALDGVRVKASTIDDDGASKAGIEALEETVIAAFVDGQASLEIMRDGRAMTVDIVGEPGCATRFHLEPSAKLNARADGTYVVVTTAISGVVRDEGELAAVLAHELAHNTLRHRAYLDRVGRKSANVRATEIAADRESIHLLKNAGYDPASAVRFWENFGPRRRSLFAGRDHPGWRTRVRLMRAEFGQLPAGR